MDSQKLNEMKQRSGLNNDEIYEKIISIITQKLKEMKQRSGLTVEEISEKTNGELPISTINNILSGRTQDARFSTIVTFVYAVGGNLAELDTVLKKGGTIEHTSPHHKHGHHEHDCTKCEDKLAKNKDLYERIVSEQKEQIIEIKTEKKRLEGIITKKDKWIVSLFSFNAVVLVLTFLFLFFKSFS